MKKHTHFEPTKAFHDLFEEALEAHNDEFVRHSLKDVNSADIASLLDEFDGQKASYVLNLLDRERQASVVVELEKDVREHFLHTQPTAGLAEMVNELDSDDAVDMLNETPEVKRQEVVAQLDDETRKLVLDLLHYDDDVAGGLMAKELIRARVEWTVAQCIEAMHKQAEEVDKFHVVYVVDRYQRLLGTVPLHKLILSKPTAQLKDIYLPDPIFVRTDQDETEVVEIMRKYDLETIPVVNAYRRLVGRITIDDAIERIADRAEEERQLMGGISQDVEEHNSVWKLTRARLPWLLIGILGGLVSVKFIGLFKADMARITAIAFFIPLIQATSGNVGIQSSSIVVQSLVSPGFIQINYQRRLIKVFSVAILNGLLLSLIVLMINMAVGANHKELSWVVSLALFVVVVFASLIGTITPLLLHKMGLNPALASGPFITTINDLLGLGIYMLAIHLLL